MKGCLFVNMLCDYCVLQWCYNIGSQVYQIKNYLMYESKIFYFDLFIFIKICIKFLKFGDIL